MSGYIMDLRKIVGHRTLLQVGASVIVEDEQGRVLLQKRTDNHCWGYPGGSTELDERVEDAAARELFGVFSGKELHYIYPNGDEVSNVDIVFICTAYSGVLRQDKEETEALAVFEPGKLPENRSPPVGNPQRARQKKKLGSK